MLLRLVCVLGSRFGIGSGAVWMFNVFVFFLFCFFFFWGGGGFLGGGGGGGAVSLTLKCEINFAGIAKSTGKFNFKANQ